MSELSGEEVVGKRIAPACVVLFRCPTCKGVAPINAYKGVPTCTCKPRNPFMVPIRLWDSEVADTFEFVKTSQEEQHGT